MQWEHSYLPVDLFIMGGLTIVENGFLHSGFQVSFAMLSSLLPIICNRSWLFVITVWGLFFRTSGFGFGSASLVIGIGIGIGISWAASRCRKSASAQSSSSFPNTAVPWIVDCSICS
jgi:hypothetical protein